MIWLPPDLFSVIVKRLLREHVIIPNFIIGGCNFYNIRYAGLLAVSERKLQGFLHKVVTGTKKKRLTIYCKKMERFLVKIRDSTRRELPIVDFVIKQSLISRQCFNRVRKWMSKIQRWTEIAKDQFQMSANFLRNWIIFVRKKREFNNYIISILHDAIEFWTIARQMKKGFEVTEMEFNRILLRIP